MKIIELRGKKSSELSDLLKESLKELCHLRLSRAVSEFKQTHKFAVLRKKIARLKTFQCEQKRAGETT